MRNLFEVKSHVQTTLVKAGLLGKVSIGLGRENVILSVQGNIEETEIKQVFAQLYVLFSNEQYVEIRKDVVNVKKL